MKNKTWIGVLVVLVVMAVVPTTIGSSSQNTISFSYEDDDIDNNLKTAYSDISLFPGDDFERTLVDENWSGKTLTELAAEGKIKFAPDFSVRYDATGDGDVDDWDDYTVYNDLFFEDVSNDSIKLTPQHRVGYVEDIKGNVFKVRGQKHVLIDYSENSVDIVPVDEKTFLDDSMLLNDMLDMDFCCLIPGTDVKIAVRDIKNESNGPSVKIVIVEGGVVKRYVVRSGNITPSFKVGEDMALLDGYYFYVTKIDISNQYFNMAIGRKSDEISLSNGDRGFQGYDQVFLREDSETSKTELIFQDPSIVVERSYKARLGNTDVYAVYDSNGTFDLIREKTVSTASGSKLRVSKTPWSEFLTSDVIVTAVGTNVEFGYESQDIDDRDTTEVEGATEAGDDVELTPTREDTWTKKWVVGDKLVSLSPNFNIHPGYTNNSAKYGVWYDATGDGDVSDADDYPIYNDFYIVDWKIDGITLKPAMRVGDLEKLKGVVFKLKGQKYLVRDYTGSSVSVVKVDERTLLDESRGGDFLEPAVIQPPWPGPEVLIRLRTLTNSTGGHGNSIKPSAKFAIIRGGAVQEYIERSSSTYPPLETGIDLELLPDYYVYATKIDVPAGYINLAVGKKPDEFIIHGGEVGVLGYAKAWVNPGAHGDWPNEFRLDDEEILVSRLGGGEARLGNTSTYVKYPNSKSFDIIKKEVKALTASGSTLNTSKSPWSDFLKRDVTVWISGGERIVLLANSIDYGLASDFIAFLRGRGYDIVHTSPADFESYKDEETVVILGGPDAYDGMGEIVQQVLTEDEENAIRQSGSRKMYVKTNVWNTGQKVIVIAGSDRNQTKATHQENREQVIEGI